MLRIAILSVLAAGLSACATGADQSVAERNKEIALSFYEDLWFSNNTDAYVDYVDETYVIHDIGEAKGLIETAITQKQIADAFHGFGELSGEIDYQIAEGDKVATRWFVSLAPNSAALNMGMTPIKNVAIINVFRFNEDGKIIEIWNHRHDVELPQPPLGPRGIEN
ncbi:MAG: ester cyclase [Pseudomonadota bacterium]